MSSCQHYPIPEGVSLVHGYCRHLNAVCRLTRPSISIRISFLAHTNVNNRENDPPIMASVRPYSSLQASLRCRASAVSALEESQDRLVSIAQTRPSKYRITVGFTNLAMR